MKRDISPIVYSMQEQEYFSYESNHINEATAAFLATRKGDERDHPVQSSVSIFR